MPIPSPHPNFPLALLLSTLAGASTGLGALLTVFQPNPTPSRLGLFQAAAAGFMLSVSFFDLAPSALSDLDVYPFFVFSLSGALLFLLLKFYIPEPSLLSTFSKTSPDRKDVLLSGVLTAAGIALHNLPEGVAVCVASLRGLRFGLPLAIAIGLHNIPEGMAVALPLWFATGDRRYAVSMAFWSGMAEPVGVLFVLIMVQLTGGISKVFVASSISAVTGVMIILSVAELMPQAVKHAGMRLSIAAMFTGLVAMAVLLVAMESLGVGV